jgi:hypothetical protein
MGLVSRGRHSWLRGQAVWKQLPDPAGLQTRRRPRRVLRAFAGYEAAMDIGRIVREVEALPDTDEEPLPLSEPTPEPLSEPAEQPV